MNNAVTVENLMRVLPAPLDRDPGMHELGQTTAEALVRSWPNLRLPMLYTRIDELPESLLDILAKDFGVAWYDFDADISIKRETIKTARKVYRTLGTKAGTQRAAQNYASDAQVEEWFQYGGAPYHFRIRTRQSDAYKNASAIARSVDIVKRLSAKLDALLIDHPFSLSLYTGLALYSGCRTQYTMQENDADAKFQLALTDENGALLLDENTLCLFDEGGSL